VCASKTDAKAVEFIVSARYLHVRGVYEICVHAYICAARRRTVLVYGVVSAVCAKGRASAFLHPLLSRASRLGANARLIELLTTKR
jgi:hypothetical protein